MITYCINNKCIKLNNMFILILFNILNVKGFKYAKNFKSKKKIQRFMREAFLRRYDKFTNLEIFNLMEYLLHKGI